MRYRSRRARRLLLFTWDGIPVYTDWSLPVGLLLVGGGIAMTASTFLGFFVLIFAHELGHTALARRYGYGVNSLLIHGFGGECEYTGNPTSWEQSVMSWGGVMGQAVLFALVFVPIYFNLVPPHIAKSGFVGVAGGYNVFSAAYNLLPLRGLDGQHAWRILRLAYLRWKRRRLGRQLAARALRQRLDADSENTLH